MVIQINLHSKCLISLFLLLFLFPNLAIGDTACWCEEAGSFSHLEFNTGGKCWSNCDTAGAAELRFSSLTARSSTTISNFGHNCFDFSVSPLVVTSLNRNGGYAKIAEKHINSLNPFSLLASPLVDLTLKGYFLTLQSLPRQVLIALRTVVLLH